MAILKYKDPDTGEVKSVNTPGVDAYSKTQTNELLSNFYNKEESDGLFEKYYTQAEVDAMLQRRPNPNLLDNWYFANPVDQRGGYVALPDTPYYSDTGLTTQAGVLTAYTVAVYVSDKVCSITVDSVEYYVGVGMYIPKGSTSYTDPELTHVASSSITGIYPVKDLTDTYASFIASTGVRYVAASTVRQGAVRGYTGAQGYWLDRWTTYNADGGSVLTDEGLQMTSNGAATQGHSQRVEATRLVAGQTYTLSALVKSLEDTSETENYHMALSYGVTTNSNTYTNWVKKEIDLSDFAVISWTFVLDKSTDGLYNFRIRSGAYGRSSYIVKAMKLELGTEQTIAHQDENGKWVLNEIPNYAEELRKCQRYYFVLNQAGVGAATTGANPSYGHFTEFNCAVNGKQTAILFQLPVPMRIVPAISFSGTIVAYKKDTTVGMGSSPVFSGFANTYAYSASSGGAILTECLFASDLTANAVYQFRAKGDANAKIIFDANL